MLAARAGKSRLGARVVEVELAADEDLAVALTLSRKGKKIALKRFAQVKEGRRVLTLVLPKTLRKGIATLGIAADDDAGNRKGGGGPFAYPASTRAGRSPERPALDQPSALPRRRAWPGPIAPRSPSTSGGVRTRGTGAPAPDA